MHITDKLIKYEANVTSAIKCSHRYPELSTTHSINEQEDEKIRK